MYEKDKVYRMKRSIPVKKIPFWLGMVLTLPLGALACLLALYIQPCSFLWVMDNFLKQPILLLLNFLPIWLTVLAFSALMKNPFFGSAAGGGIWGVLSLVSRTMIEKRDEPLSPKDFALLKEAANAVQSYDMSISLSSVAALAGFIVVMVVLGIFIRCRVPGEKRWQRVLLQAGCGVAAAVLLFSVVQFWYSSQDLYMSLKVRNRYYITGVYEDLGFPYCFCYNFNTYLIDVPEGFSLETAEAYGEQTAMPREDKPVHVVMVMCEAFSDVTNHPAFTYPDGQEPLQNYNRLIQEENAISGHLVVPNYGAGTANTEFDVITGMQTNLLSAAGTSAFRVLHRDVNSIYRVFDESGYLTDFIHPGQDWFYNRQNVYRYFGAEQLAFVDDFAGAEKKGQWITDQAVLEKIKENFQDAVEKDEMFFNYTVTIQNHMSYTAEKYGNMAVPEVQTSVSLTPEAKTMLSVYAQGAADGDKMLGDLTEYFRQRQEPVVVVFFGDHLPNLGNNYLCYQELGMDVGKTDTPQKGLETYETPYVIWANPAASETLEFAKAKESLELPENGLINANYLGQLVLELTGRSDNDPFFSFLGEMRRELPVYHFQTGCTAKGEYFSEIPGEYDALMEKMTWWQYYRLQYETVARTE